MLPELTLCAEHWSALLAQPHEGRDWALHARSVTDRAGRWVQEFTSEIYQRLQPKAEVLGAAFDAEPWTVPLFSEEVIRGGPAFTLSLLLRPLDRILRQQAGLGGWQVISPARAIRQGSRGRHGCSTCRASASPSRPCSSPTRSAARRRSPKARRRS